MRIFFVLTLLTLITVSLELHKKVANFALFFHNSCTDWSPGSGEFHPIFLALSCGEAISQTQLFGLFRAHGIVHLMVISGAHLAFIERLGTRLRSPYWVIWLGLLLMTLMSGARPPALRAFAFYNAYLFAKKYQLNWSPLLTTSCTGLGLLLIFPYWGLSLSFLMSWMASLLIHSVKASLLFTCAWMYLGLMPILIFLGLPHPLSILMNWLFTPLFSLVLFPLTLLGYLTPALYSSTHWLWSLTVKGLTLLQMSAPMPALQLSHTSLYYIWPYLIGFSFWALRKK